MKMKTRSVFSLKLSAKKQAFLLSKGLLFFENHAYDKF
jgi:hypothetical protein